MTGDPYMTQQFVAAQRLNQPWDASCRRMYAGHIGPFPWDTTAPSEPSFSPVWQCAPYPVHDATPTPPDHEQRGRDHQCRPHDYVPKPNRERAS